MHRKITRRNISLVRYSIVILILTWIRYFKKKILAGTRIRWFNTQHWAATEIAQWRQTIRLCIIPGILDSFVLSKNNNVSVTTWDGCSFVCMEMYGFQVKMFGFHAKMYEFQAKIYGFHIKMYGYM